MNIVISGGTGFLGRHLSAHLAGSGHTIVALSRQARQAGATMPNAQSNAKLVPWDPNGRTGAWSSVIDGADAVVNLTGESIAGRRWTPVQKQRILESRVLATRSLVQAIEVAKTPPSVLINGSAVGYYGGLGDQVVTEETPAGHDVLAGICVRWEAEAMRAASARTRVVAVRTGIVLDRHEGALPQMLPPFWFGVGGPVGSGRQYWPWIHRQDWIALVQFALETGAVSGPLNATAPHPVPNAQFAKALGRAIHRPALLPTPGFALRLLLGQMADELLLSGQRAVPAKAERLGFSFRYPNLDDALAAIFQKGAGR